VAAENCNLSVSSGRASRFANQQGERAILTALLVLLLSFTLTTVSTGEEANLAAASIVWKEKFGQQKQNPSTVYSLMGNGFFLAPTSTDMNELLQKWLLDHPQARVIPVTTIQPMMRDDAESRMVYVWLTEGESNANLYLVRMGACAAISMRSTKENDLQVKREEYDKFVKMVIEAEQQARSDKVGIWGKTTR
jgi:hypothetical protein